MGVMAVRADKVQVGQYLWCGVGGARWTLVHSVRRSDSGNYVVISTLAGETWKHPAEGVAVQDACVIEKRIRGLDDLENGGKDG